MCVIRVMSIKINFIYNLPKVFFFREVWEQARSQGFPPEGNEAGLEMQKALQVLNWNCSQSIVVCAFATLRMVRFAVRFATLSGLKETGFYICGRGSSTYAHAKLFFFNNFICLLCLDMLSDRNIGIKVWLVIKSWWCSNLPQSWCPPSIRIWEPRKRKCRFTSPTYPSSTAKILASNLEWLFVT